MGKLKEFFTKGFSGKRGLDFNRKRKQQDGPVNAGSAVFVGQMVCAVLLGVFLAFMFFSGGSISGGSMEKTLYSGNRFFLSRITRFVPPKIGDVIAFNNGNAVSSTMNIKRVVALPGDVVIIKNGDLYVNDQLQKLDVDFEKMEDFGIARAELTLENDEYFLLGDNRNNSEDSRYQSIGTVKSDEILGIVWFCYSPSNFGFIR